MVLPTDSIMIPGISNECKTLVLRLKQCDVDKIMRNPSLMLKYYPIRDPDNENTVFDEVYRLINENILRKSYKFRIFYFLNIFLSSTKVPAYVIAAYTKRLARLTLDAKPRTLVAILRIVHNIFVRHPILITLRDRVDEKARELEQNSDTCTLRSWLEDDLFDLNQVQDLRATRAMDSCIWELMPLRFHENRKVAEAAQFLGETGVPDMECDLDDILK